MGSFRIVTGTGYGRREITNARALRREFDLLKQTARRASENPPRVRAKRNAVSGGKAAKDIAAIYDRVWDNLVRKANKWARETAAEMRSEVPVDTGNLYESIHVLEKDCYRNKSTGEIIMVVGVDLDPAGGPRKLYAPPHRKRSERYGRKNAPWKGYRLMPGYPDEYASKFLEETTIDQRFSALSRKNAKKIMGK